MKIMKKGLALSPYPRECQGFLQTLHGRDKLLNYEDPLHFSDVPQSWSIVDTTSLAISADRTIELANVAHQLSFAFALCWNEQRLLA